MIVDAIKFAAIAHEGMKRKGTSQPYIFHPLEVLSLASLLTDDEEILCAAVLHDTIEDTNTSLKEITERFGASVAQMVDDETEDKRGNINKEETWKQRKSETIERIWNVENIGSKIICLSDKLSNLRSIHMALLDKGDECWNMFNQKDPMMHYWYYSSIRDALSSLSDTPVYKEYSYLVDAVFEKYKGEQIEK